MDMNTIFMNLEHYVSLLKKKSNLCILLSDKI